MASNYDYFLNTDAETAKSLTDSVLTGRGYTVSTTPDGGFLAEIGSKGLTIAFGGLAGSKFYRSFVLQFFSAEAQFVVRLNQQGAGKVLGGAIGVAKSNATFAELAQALGEAYTGAGLLANTVAN